MNENDQTPWRKNPVGFLFVLIVELFASRPVCDTIRSRISEWFAQAPGASDHRSEIDEELIEAYRGTESLPFDLGKHRRVAVKIIDDRGIESLKVIEV